LKQLRLREVNVLFVGKSIKDNVKDIKIKNINDV
jgi:hypothetical protein